MNAGEIVGRREDTADGDFASIAAFPRGGMGSKDTLARQKPDA
jgi:hypothetical protein